jgi:hypothetical protein
MANHFIAGGAGFIRQSPCWRASKARPSGHNVGLFGAGVAWFAAQSSLALVILGRSALNR